MYLERKINSIVLMGHLGSQKLHGRFTTALGRKWAISGTIDMTAL